MDLKVILQAGEDGSFVAHVPALRGCWSQGPTREEAMQNVKEATRAWLEVEQDKADTSDKAGDIELVRI